MTNKAVRANLTYAKIRVGVAVTSTNNAVNTASFNKLSALVQYVVPAAALEYVYIVIGTEIDPIGRNKFVYEYQFVADQAKLGVAKRLYDVNGTTDSKVLVFGKRLTEFKVTTETKSFTFSKRLIDSVHPTDDFYGVANADDDETMTFGKSRSDTVSKSDVRTSLLGKSRSDAVSKSDVQTSLFSKALSDSNVTVEITTVSIEKSLADSVDAGDEFNATALTDDGEVMIFGKGLMDSFAQSDFVSVQPEKNVDDSAATYDYIDHFDFDKGIDDVPLTSEVVAFDSSKILVDDGGASDASSIASSKRVSDRLYYPLDGPNQYDTYAPSYFLESYVREGFPAIDFAKTLSDTVQTTDDFHGVANSDDDETMQFGKVLSDAPSSSDSKTFFAGKALSDSFANSDALTSGVGKALTDAFSKSDAATRDTGKSFADVFSKSDIVVNSTGKGLDDSATSGDNKTFALSKSLLDSVHPTDDFLGVANADDDEVMTFNKTASDSFTKSDVASLTPGKGLTDSVSNGDSGSLVWTDYWDIGYTVTTGGVYVGNTRTF